MILVSQKDLLLPGSISKRQSSVGAASVGFEAGEEENQVDLASMPFVGNCQEIVDREVANFLSFANHTRAQVPDDQPLFFSDLAPVADSSVSSEQCRLGSTDLIRLNRLT